MENNGNNEFLYDQTERPSLQVRIFCNFAGVAIPHRFYANTHVILNFHKLHFKIRLSATSVYLRAIFFHVFEADNNIHNHLLFERENPQP